jgi:hypothetical protein
VTPKPESFSGASASETLDLVALTLARYGDAVNTKLSDVIPQAVWDGLTERGLIYHARDVTGEGTCDATTDGAEYLIERVSALAC